ncbi:MAG: hypothetical protein ABIH23_08455 [bacterium]
MIDSTNWFSPAPSEVSSSRISLDFGLRAADLFFRELVVPELGRIWFVRQFSWPLASLALHESLQGEGSNAPKPTAICHGIESLACKLEYREYPKDPSARILGRRAFGRDTESVVWSFQRLHQPLNYVRNTHRQAATRAIRQDGGLGFATGVRFDLLELEPVGRALAGVFLEQRVGKGGTSLHKWLLGWLRGKRDIPDWSETLVEALSPEHPTANERDLVRSRVLETSTAHCKTRQHLVRAFGRAMDLPDIEGVVVPRLRDAGHRRQADEVIAARAFGAMLDRARDATAKLTRAVEPGRGGLPVATLARDAALRKALAALRDAAKNFSLKTSTAGITEPTSQAFAEALLGAADDLQAIKFLVGRVAQVLGLADDSVIRGALFRVVDATESLDGLEEGADSIEPDRTGRTFRIANLHSLLRDAGQRRAL